MCDSLTNYFQFCLVLIYQTSDVHLEISFSLHHDTMMHVYNILCMHVGAGTYMPRLAEHQSVKAG